MAVREQLIALVVALVVPAVLLLEPKTRRYLSGYHFGREQLKRVHEVKYWGLCA